MLGSVNKRLEKTESKLESMERKLEKTSSGSSSEGVSKKKFVPQVVRVRNLLTCVAFKSEKKPAYVHSRIVMIILQDLIRQPSKLFISTYNCRGFNWWGIKREWSTLFPCLIINLLLLPSNLHYMAHHYNLVQLILFLLFFCFGSRQCTSTQQTKLLPTYW